MEQYRNEAKEFLGTGWKFPIEVDEITGRIKMSNYEEDIKESIGIIMRTRKGERMMMPEFGCDLYEYVYETMDDSSLSRMENEIMNALIVWEPRITDIEVRVYRNENTEGQLDISVKYVVRSTNNLFNMVYPYYINEGLGIDN